MSIIWSQPHVRKDRDAHWRISERSSCGRQVGWFVEHDGYVYDGLEGGYDEHRPHPSRAIEQVREREAG